MRKNEFPLGEPLAICFLPKGCFFIVFWAFFVDQFSYFGDFCECSESKKNFSRHARAVRGRIAPKSQAFKITIRDVCGCKLRASFAFVILGGVLEVSGGPPLCMYMKNCI